MITRVKIKQFGGLSEIDLNLESGVNVLLGENEAGKSTVIEFIYSIFFQNNKLTKNKSKDKQFVLKAMRFPDGDYAAGEIFFTFADDKYRLKKEWSYESPSLELEKNGELIKDINKINAIIEKFLIHGEGTYKNIFFAKQEDYKKLFSEIKADQEALNTVQQLLQKATINLDGISIKGYFDHLDRKIAELTEKWDFQNFRPEKNRGIDHPYLHGKGEIITHYYQKEMLKKEIQDAEHIEEQIADINHRYVKVEKELSETDQKISDAEKIEKDAIIYEKISGNLLHLDKEINQLQMLNTEWPKHEWKKEQAEEEAEELKNQTDQLKEQVSYLIKKEKEIDSLQKKIEIMEATLQSLSFTGRVELIKDPIIAEDVAGQRRDLKTGDSWQADGFTKIFRENDFSITISAGEDNYHQIKEELSETLKKLKNIQDTFTEAKDKKKTEEKLLATEKEYQKIITNLNYLSRKIDEWEENFENHEKVLHTLVSLMGKKKDLEQDFKKINRIPDQYSSTEEFLENLKVWRKKSRELLSEKNSLKNEADLLAASLSEYSSEELLDMKKEAETKFTDALQQAKKLYKIREIFEETVTEAESISINPLTEKFITYINNLTDGKYGEVEVQDTLDIRIKSKNQELSLDILSSGMTDLVALSFRLALIEEISQTRASFLILDDCLVNLDPTRQKKAVELIKHHGQEHQILLATCNPQIADCLEGHQIQLR